LTIQNPLYTNGINNKKGEEHMSKLHHRDNLSTVAKSPLPASIKEEEKNSSISKDLELCWTTNEESEKGKVKFAYFITRTTKSLPKKKEKKANLNPSTQHKNNLTKNLNGKLSPTAPAKEKKNAQG
jgi:hypothetical protein